MEAFCPYCGGADGRCADSGCPGARLSDVVVVRLPRAELSRRLGGSGLEVLTFVLLDLVGLLLSPFTLATAGMVTGLAAAAYVALKDLGGGRLSIGKRIARVRVVDVYTLAPASPVQALTRNSGFILGWTLAVLPDPAGILGLGCVLVFGTLELLVLVSDPRGRRLGDRLAGTQVVPEEEP